MKPKYETPVMVPLGEMARGAGAKCTNGSGASASGSNVCSTGNGAISTGGGSNKGCGPGNSPVCATGAAN